MNMAKRISKKWLWLIFPLLMITVIITDSGFCYSEKRLLSKQEVVNRIKPSNSSGDSTNCRISSGKPNDIALASNVLNLLSGRKLYQVECVFPREGQEEPYYWQISSTDACASKIIDISGMGISRTEYEANLKAIQKFWQENEKWPSFILEVGITLVFRPWPIYFCMVKQLGAPCCFRINLIAWV